jgi:hypothetical protein
MTMEDPTKKLRIGIEDAFDRRSEAAMRAQSHRLGLMSVQQHQLERPTVDPAEVAFTSSLGIDYARKLILLLQVKYMFYLRVAIYQFPTMRANAPSVDSKLFFP